VGTQLLADGKVARFLGFELHSFSLEEFADFRKGGKRNTFPGATIWGTLAKSSQRI
jgi:hypothetical protein